MTTMKLTAQIPTTRDKTVTLDFDPVTGEVGIMLPASLSTPRVGIDDLRDALADFDRLSGHRGPGKEGS